MDYPKYVSHKEVGAVKIAAVDKGADGSIAIHLEDGFDNVVISHHDAKHKPVPEAGWYLLRYADGYVSFSPGPQFEQGYSPLALSEEEDPEVADAANDHGQGAEAQESLAAI